MPRKKRPPGLEVMRRACDTCIYRKDNSFDAKALEEPLKDPHMGMTGYRVCHHHTRAVCRGFWNRHKDEFPIGQIAQRLKKVILVDSTR